MLNNKEEILKQFNTGWYTLINKAYSANELSFYNGIEFIERKNGMFCVRYIRTSEITEYQNFVFECLEYKLERMSSRICEGCGKHSIRRTDLPVIQSLCTACYALTYSEIHTTVPPKVANPEPQ